MRRVTLDPLKSLTRAVSKETAWTSMFGLQTLCSSCLRGMPPNRLCQIQVSYCAKSFIYDLWHDSSVHQFITGWFQWSSPGMKPRKMLQTLATIFRLSYTGQRDRCPCGFLTGLESWSAACLLISKAACLQGQNACTTMQEWFPKVVGLSWRLSSKPCCNMFCLLPMCITCDSDPCLAACCISIAPPRASRGTQTYNESKAHVIHVGMLQFVST